ncbi:MAG: hypothetical protein IJG24_01545 [Selenomonadaceae bacterium]|nr:hypothetical protein [Selenomonadaceae bacterium]
MEFIFRGSPEEFHATFGKYFAKDLKTHCSGTHRNKLHDYKFVDEDDEHDANHVLIDDRLWMPQEDEC